MHVNRAGPVNPETSLAAKLYITFKFSLRYNVSFPGKYVSAVARASVRGYIVPQTGCKLR